MVSYIEYVLCDEDESRPPRAAAGRVKKKKKNRRLKRLIHGPPHATCADANFAWATIERTAAHGVVLVVLVQANRTIPQGSPDPPRHGFAGSPPPVPAAPSDPGDLDVLLAQQQRRGNSEPFPVLGNAGSERSGRKTSRVDGHA